MIKLVLVKLDGQAEPGLFEAPYSSYIKDGDRVLIDGELYGDVVTSMAFYPEVEEKELDFVIAVAGATKPLRRISHVVQYRELEYE